MMIHYTDYNPRKHKINYRKAKDKYTTHDILTFDIETTSININKETQKIYDNETFDRFVTSKTRESTDFIRTSVCYIWMLSINENVFYGRYIEEVIEFISIIKPTSDHHITIYCHYLPFEFQHIQKLFKWEYVNAKKQRDVLMARTHDNITFKCSYALSGTSLANATSKYNLTRAKLDGDLDYTKLRHSATPLTQKELAYCEYDCLITHDIIQAEQNIQETRNITLTKTGKVRRQAKKSFGADAKYRQLKTSYQTPTVAQYKQLKRAFRGGYTHANHLHVDKTLHNIISRDLKSSYPSQMFSKEFPTGDISTFSEDQAFDPKYAYIYEVTFKNIQSINSNHYISFSKNATKGSYKLDNGRIVRADELNITITDIDLKIIQEVYEWEQLTIDISKSFRSPYEPLPDELKILISNLFEEKERLSKLAKKGDKNAELNLVEVKASVNSLYGMSVTNYVGEIVFYDKLDEFIYNDQLIKDLMTAEELDQHQNKDQVKWNAVPLTDEIIQMQLDKLKADKKILFPFAWGVWITAHARLDLWNMIININDDIVYSDTDSNKYFNKPEYNKLFEDFNTEKIKENKRIAQELEQRSGVTISKEVYNLGIWEVDGIYKEFRTLGAKKYACNKLLKDKAICKRSGKEFDKYAIEITIAGVPKKTGSASLYSLDFFRDGYIFDKSVIHKNSKSYCDDTYTVSFVDYRGQRHQQTTQSGVCVFPTSYLLSLSECGGLE